MKGLNLFILLLEFLIFWLKISLVNSSKSCWLLSDKDNEHDQITVKKTETLTITCKSQIKEICAAEMLTVTLFKKNTILGQLSEKSRTIEYRFKIKNVQISDSGKYICVFRSKYNSLNTTTVVTITDGSENNNNFIPEEIDLIKSDRFYLGQEMRNKLSVKHVVLGSSCQFECQFYSPRKNISLNIYWIKHREKTNYTFGTLLLQNDKTNIIRHDTCEDINNSDLLCINSKLKLTDITSKDHGFFTCGLKAINATMKEVHSTFRLMVDATIKNSRMEKTNAELPSLEFSINSSICFGNNFSIFCAADDPNLKMYLYKVDPLTDLSRPILYMNDSILLKVRLPYTAELSVLNEKDRPLIDNNQVNTFINYTFISVSFNDTGRYLCVIEDFTDMSIKWKSMYLSVEYCFHVTTTTKYVLFAVSINMLFLLIICLFIIIHCKHKNDEIKKFPIRKIIIIEYESPIYKSVFNGTKNYKSDASHLNHFLPDSNPILAPIIKIKPIKKSLQYFKNGHYREQLPSTSTDRTRLESTRFSSQMDNDVFECNPIDHNLKIKYEIRKSSSALFDSMYEFPHDNQWEFPREKLKLSSHKLGEGAFGMVFEGFAKEICGKEGVTKVGVKMMKDNFSDSNVLDFIKEIETMKQLGRHRHVIQLFGVCTQSGPLQVIVELAPYGNLRDYLRSKGFKSCKSSKYHSTLSRSILCIYSLQIARGMTYLSSRSVVHRDLSARNILVGKNYDMKIADFGLTRIVDYYYRKKTDGILPVKWMAPEALLEKKYTTKSDVWSYGILLWEIFSLGESPYSSILPENVVDIIKKGIQNPQPFMANLEIYRLMQLCWSLYTENRPHFYQIVDLLREILLRVSDEPEQNIYHSETNYLEMEAEYLEPKESFS